MMRLAGFLFFVVGIVLGAFDWNLSGRSVEALEFRSFSVIWFTYDRASLASFQPWLEGLIGAWAWENAVRHILALPAAPTLMMLGLLCFLFGLRGGGRTRYR
jgi:hypothetical protein